MGRGPLRGNQGVDQERVVADFFGAHDGIIPMHAVVQPNKHKVRPGLDFRELSDHVLGTMDKVLCAEKYCASREGQDLQSS